MAKNQKKKKHPFMRFFISVLKKCSKKKEIIFEEKLAEEPCVFLANHDRAFGPFTMIVNMKYEYRLRPWSTVNMCEMKRIPAHIRKDYWWKPNKWYSKILDYTVPYLVAPIFALLLKSVEAIPVYNTERGIVNTINNTIDVLNGGENVLIFPEQSQGYDEYQSQLGTGFVQLGKKYYKKTGKILKFYPCYASRKTGTINIAAPVLYDPSLSSAEQKEYLTREVYKIMKNLEEKDEEKAKQMKK